MKWSLVLTVLLSSMLSRAYDPVSLNNSIEMDDVSAVKKLIDSGEITVNEKMQAPGYSSPTPLITVAARAAALKTLKYLIDGKADLNAPTPVQETALLLAAYFADQFETGNSTTYVDHETAVHMLVDAGASLENPAPNSYSALAYAAYAGHDRILTYLLQKGENPNAPAVGEITTKDTALMMNAVDGTLAMALDLLRAGADAKITTAGGKTARDIAVAQQQKSQVPYLLCAEGLKPGEDFHTKCE